MTGATTPAQAGTLQVPCFAQATALRPPRTSSAFSRPVCGSVLISTTGRRPLAA
ncbi:hypothetical protein OG946_09240 [Streptomyces sp. NBC_01808]|uniref:hypothetical protein n=1 Tax=Streptomyces sp. NBC_01808 TaxID=2975947 RepID=UPI002DD8F00B|nr:hypothetical protein [Streptomyces sp. NBC_01808]WSA37552.1 hypothetical protein OG946_09240 [Streptomyces sp. NBC_01808]